MTTDWKTRFDPVFIRVNRCDPWLKSSTLVRSPLLDDNPLKARRERGATSRKHMMVNPRKWNTLGDLENDGPSLPSTHPHLLTFEPAYLLPTAPMNADYLDDECLENDHFHRALISRLPRRRGILAVISLSQLLLCLFPGSASAQLPTLPDKALLGYHAVYQDQSIQFKISGNGKMQVAPMRSKTVMMGAYVVLPIFVGVEEILPDGQTRFLNLIPESLKSSSDPTAQLSNTVITGKVAEGVTVETTVQQSRGVILINGKICEVKPEGNPMSYVIRTHFPFFYGHLRLEEPEVMEKFVKLIKDDHVKLKWVNKKSYKEMFLTPLTGGNETLNGQGISSADFSSISFGKKVLRMSTSEGSVMSLSPNPYRKREPGHQAVLYEGFLIRCTAESPAACSLSFEFK
jgi:hypothetical protein